MLDRTLDLMDNHAQALVALQESQRAADAKADRNVKALAHAINAHAGSIEAVRGWAGTINTLGERQQVHGQAITAMQGWAKAINALASRLDEQAATIGLLQDVVRELLVAKAGEAVASERMEPIRTAMRSFTIRDAQGRIDSTVQIPVSLEEALQALQSVKPAGTPAPGAARPG